MEVEFESDFDMPDTTLNEFEIIGNAGALFTALATAQSQFKAVNETNTVNVSPKNQNQRPYSYKYADLSNYIDMVRPILNKQKIYLSQTVTKGRVQTILAGHGAVVVFTTNFANSDLAPQQQGSLFSYYKRYSLAAALGVASGGDDVDADDLNDDIAESNIVPIMAKPKRGRPKKQIPENAPKDFQWWNAWCCRASEELDEIKGSEELVQKYVTANQVELAELKEFDQMMHDDLIAEINAAKKEMRNG